MSQKASMKPSRFVSLKRLQVSNQTGFGYISRRSRPLFRAFFELTSRLVDDYQCARWRGRHITEDSLGITRNGHISLPRNFDTMDDILRETRAEGTNFRQMMSAELPAEIQRWGRWYLSILFGLSDPPEPDVSLTRRRLISAGVFEESRNRSALLEELAVFLVRLSVGEQSSSGRYLHKYRTPYFFLQDLIGVYQLYGLKVSSFRSPAHANSPSDLFRMESFLRCDERVYEGPQRQAIELKVELKYSLEQKKLFSSSETEESDIPL